MAELIRTEGIPIYIQIRETLRGEIARDVLKRGEKLLSEQELASRFGVSRMTVRQSIAELIDEGLLYRRHGVGTFVALPHLERDHTDRKSTRLNSSHHRISYAVFCLKK